MSDIEFINGLNFKAPNENAPDYVLAKGWIKLAELVEWAQARIKQGEESVNFDLKRSKAGKPYAAVDNWKPNGQDKPKPRSAPPADDDGDRIPF